ncbi:MAG TPA: hypothetical protein VMT00_14200 [Thermoanaerobaculia bacterium]|nr:hypothetical protein [Thermoanaerobaculia bacterium]
MESFPPGTPPGPPPEPVHEGGSFQRPADYYSAPTTPGEQRKGCPRPVLIGCGGGGCLVLLLLFIGGAWMMKGGAGWMLNYAISKIEGEITELATPEVSSEEREELREGLREVRAKIERDEIKLVEVQPLLEQLQSSIRDRRVTPEETRELNETLRRLNRESPDTP